MTYHLTNRHAVVAAIGVFVVCLVYSGACGASSTTAASDEVRKIIDASEVVARAKVLRTSELYEPAMGIAYRIVTFELHDVYKEPSAGMSVMPVFLKEPTRQIAGRYINVVVLARVTVSEYLPPSYADGKEYLLYLCRVGPFLYGRSQPDEYQREHIWSEELATSVKMHLATPNVVGPGKGDRLVK